MVEDDDYDDDIEYTEAEAEENLKEVAARLAIKRGELRRTIRAIQSGRRTPQQLRAVLDRARLAVYRSTLLQRKIRMRYRPQ